MSIQPTVHSSAPYPTNSESVTLPGTGSISLYPSSGSAYSGHVSQSNTVSKSLSALGTGYSRSVLSSSASLVSTFSATTLSHSTSPSNANSVSHSTGTAHSPSVSPSSTVSLSVHSSDSHYSSSIMSFGTRPHPFSSSNTYSSSNPSKTPPIGTGPHNLQRFQLPDTRIQCSPQAVGIRIL